MTSKKFEDSIFSRIKDREPEMSAADYRLKPRLRICGITGNLTHDPIHERPVSYTMFDMIGRFPKANRIKLTNS